MKHNIQLNIDPSVIKQLLTGTKKDGVQELVVGAVITPSILLGCMVRRGVHNA